MFERGFAALGRAELCLLIVAALGMMGYYFANVRFLPVMAGFAILAGVCFSARGIAASSRTLRPSGQHPATLTCRSRGSDVREAIERAGDEHWQALIDFHEDAYPASRPTPGDICRAEAERLNALGLGDDPGSETGRDPASSRSTRPSASSTYSRTPSHRRTPGNRALRELRVTA